MVYLVRTHDPVRPIADLDYNITNVLKSTVVDSPIQCAVRRSRIARRGNVDATDSVRRIVDVVVNPVDIIGGLIIILRRVRGITNRVVQFKSSDCVITDANLESGRPCPIADELNAICSCRNIPRNVNKFGIISGMHRNIVSSRNNRGRLRNSRPWGGCRSGASSVISVSSYMKHIIGISRLHTNVICARSCI